MNKQGYIDIIQAIQKQIWGAEYFINQNINTSYWNGYKDSNTFALDGFRAVGISVSEIVKDLENPYQLLV